MTAREEPSASTIIVVGVTGVALLLFIIFGLQALYYNMEETENEAKVVSQAPEEITRLRAEQQEVLNGYRWIDQKNGVIGIPIESAMEQVVKETNAAMTAPAPGGKAVQK